MPWAIKNTRTHKWLYGTDYRGTKKKQRTSYGMAALWDMKESAESNLKTRGCGKEYKVVQVEIVEVTE